MSDHELSVSRYIDAPVHLVWKAWTEHANEWFCPLPWTAEVLALDLRPGGQWKVIMRGPEDDEDGPNVVDALILQVIPERLIVSTDAVNVNWEPQGPFMVRLDRFEPEGNRTRYTATARHWTAQMKGLHISNGFEHGWNTAIDQMVAVIERLKEAEHA